jgi:pteridine reductase
MSPSREETGSGTGLAGRNALVTGAAVRVGRAIAEALAAEGMNLVLHYYTRRDETEALATEVRGRGRRAIAMQADLSDPAKARALADGAWQELGGLDALVLSASSYPRLPLAALDPERVEETLQINLVSPFVLGQRIGLRMRERGHGSIVTLLDWSIDRPDPEYLAYHVAKAGLKEVTRGLARALAPQVRVNGVAPGAVLLPEGTTEDKRHRIEKKTPLGRIGSPADVAQACVYLLSAPFVTGAVLTVDGGRSLV